MTSRMKTALQSPTPVCRCRSDSGGASFLGQAWDAVCAWRESGQWQLETVPRLELQVQKDIHVAVANAVAAWTRKRARCTIFSCALHACRCDMSTSGER